MVYHVKSVFYCVSSAMMFMTATYLVFWQSLILVALGIYLMERYAKLYAKREIDQTKKEIMMGAYQEMENKEFEFAKRRKF